MGRDQVALNAQIFISPANGFFPNQTTADYQALRPFSSPQFAYCNGQFAYRTCSFLMKVRAQGATGPLLASEQFILGGMHSVRGYEQSQFLADNAVLLNLEWYMPKFSTYKPIKDQVQFLLFTDIGWGMNYKTANLDASSQWLGGIGPALRYEIPPYFNLSAEYGFKLQNVPGGDATGRFYLKSTVTY